VGFSVGNFISNVAKTVGKPVGGAVHLLGKTPLGAAVRLSEGGASSAGRLAGQALRSVPVVGKPLDDVYDIQLQPFKIVANIISGKNVKQSVLQGVGEDIEDAQGAKDVVKVVLNAFIPGAGTAASAAIGAGYTLYQKKILTTSDVAQMADAAAVVGSAIDSDSFKVAQSTMVGMDPTQAATALAKSAGNPGLANTITQGLKATKGLSDGTTSEENANAAMSALESSLKSVPSNTAKSIMNGINAGLATGQAQKLQSSMQAALSGKFSQLQVPPPILTPEETALLNSIPADEKTGLVVGLNVARTVATPSQIATIRNLLRNSRQQDGYDAALANHAGAVTSRPPQHFTPAARAGYLVHRGISGSDPTHVQNVLKILRPDVRGGADVSQAESATEWVKVLGIGAVGGLAGFEIAGPIGWIVGVALGAFAGSKL
jgi:hypothetical protein